MDDDRILQVLRAQAWERAKAELQSIRQASYAPLGREARQEWEERVSLRSELIDGFIKAMEETELYLA